MNPWEMNWNQAPQQAAPSAAPWEMDWSGNARKEAEGKLSKRTEASEPGFMNAVGRGAATRLIGIGQTLNDLGVGQTLGLPDNEILGEAVKVANERGKGTGVKGFVGEVLGDPLTAATLPMGGAGSFAKLAAQGAAVGAAGGFTAGQEEGGFGSRLANAALGAGVGAAVPGVAKAAGKVARPFKAADGEMGRLAAVAEKEGIALTPAQKTGSKTLRGVENAFAELPLTSGTQAKIADSQAQQFNRAVLSRAGINADTATPDVLDAGKKALSSGFEGISARTAVAVDDELLTRLGAIEQEASRRLGKDEAKAVNSYIDDVLASGGKIDGKTYQNTRSQLGKLAKGTQDSFKAGLLKDLQSALDDAAFRSLPAKDVAQWMQLRKQYGAYKVIEKAMGSTGQNTLAGNISPAALATAAKVGNKNYATGAGELNDLARTGAAFLRDPVGNSGTAQRLMWQSLMTGGAGLGGAYGANEGGLPGGVTGVASVLLAPKLLQTAYGRQLIQNYLTRGANAAASAPGKVTKAATAAAAVSAGRPQDKPDAVEPEPVSQPVAQQSNASDLMQRIAQAESGGNPNARNTKPGVTASGLLGFNDDTWTRAVQKWGKELGVTLKDRMNPEAQLALGQKLAEDNARILTKQLGREPTDGEVYIAHALGAPDAKKLLAAVGTNRQAITLFPRKVVNSNREWFFDGKRPRTVEEVYELLSNKVA